MNIFSTSSTSIMVTCCIWMRFKLLSLSLDMVLLYAVLSRRIPDADLSASQEPMGDMHPIKSRFLMFGKQSSSANCNTSRNPSGGFGIWYPALPSNRGFSYVGSFLLLSTFILSFWVCFWVSFRWFSYVSFLLFISFFHIVIHLLSSVFEYTVFHLLSGYHHQLTRWKMFL